MSTGRTGTHDPGMAFRNVYDAHVRFVWRVLLRLGVRESDLPDAVQDVFVVVHRKLPEFEQRSKMTTWLFTICARVASDRRQLAHRRYERPASEAPSGDLPSRVIDPEPNPDALLERRQARVILEEILGRMPEEQRTAFALFEIEGMSGEEIAQALDLPLGTVRSRLRLARAAFEQSVARLQAQERRAARLRPREA
jgi:RNA polymerase sigma-70 factor (ECF subfamily)